MNSNEPRRAWLVTLNGQPHHLKWASHKTSADCPPEMSDGQKSALRALHDNEPQSEGWDATPTEWRRCPPGMDEYTLQHADVSLAMVGRDVISGGLRYNLDDGGRVHPEHREGHECEPLEVDAVVEDEEALLDMAETLGRDVRFTEKGSLSGVIARSGERGALDAEDDDTFLGLVDVVLARKANGEKRKVERLA